MPKREKIIILDGNALLHRSFHALPPTLRTKSGELVNAVYGFTTTLLKALKDFKPEYVAVTFDLEGGTFRDEMYEDYKAQREEAPDELYEQLPHIKEVVRAFGFPIYEMKGYEADDVIATIVRHKDVEKIQSIIVTGDMDTMQLVDKNTEVFTMRRGITDTMTYDIEEVKRRFDGLGPEQMTDYKGLRGDPSDNIPGVRGIGEKGAIALLNEFGSLENLYKNIESDKISERNRKLLKEQKKEAILSKKLATMVDNVPIKFKLEDARVGQYNSAKIVQLLKDLEFRSLLTKLPKEMVADQPSRQTTLAFGDIAAPTKGVKAKGVSYTLVNDDKTFEKFISGLSNKKSFCFDTETSGLNPFEDKLLGISVCWKEGEAYYVVANAKRLETLKPIFENDKVAKAGHNLKFDIQVLETAGIVTRGLEFDSMLASYLLNPGTRQHGLDNLVFTELGYQMQSITELIGKGKDQISMADVPIEQVADYACEDADFTFRLVEKLRGQLTKRNDSGLLHKIDLPLIYVLATMERNGILLDTGFLKDMSKTVGKQITQLEQKIYKHAGQEFNVASPIQLKEILFEKLEIPTKGLAKTKTGISTSASELEKMHDLHPIIPLIGEFRELTKLKSTYLDTLPEQIGNDKRLHCSFNQTVAATGRLSSSDPNLQNIPIRTELGRKIRQAFIAEKGNVLISADYSQIELRIIASLAQDKSMIDSFKKGEDVHTRTAAEIHDVSVEKVTPEMRYAAKAINFGIIYGQGATGLSQTAGISRDEGRAFIERYFEIHSSIQQYLEATKELARKNGYVETWFGRRRYLPEINASSPMIRAGAERAAINHPIQGTAADLLKLAMIAIHEKLPKICPEARLLLQVHDELVAEAPEKDAKKVAKLIEDEMENVYELRAPVETHVAIGKTWGELK